MLEYSGKVVTRQDVRQKLWPDGIFVNFDDSINSAVKKLRQALNDSAEKPSILETLPRRGYRLIVPVERTEPAAALSPAEQVVFAPRLAVLPFKNLSGNRTQEYLAEGLTVGLVTALAKVPGICLLSKTSLSCDVGAKRNPSEVARELSVDVLLEGSVFCSADRLQATVRLLCINTGEHLWAEAYEIELRDFLGWQQKTIEAIIKAVASRIASKRRPGSGHQARREAQTAFLKARHLLDDVGKSDDGLKTACSYFHQAVRRRSGFR